jgi:glycosyltransferase involved in cell wall biosynthesis
MSARPILTLIHSTHASLTGFKKTGLFERHCKLVREYAKTFDVVVYSNDVHDFAPELGVAHRFWRGMPRAFGWNHLVYYLWLVAQARQMRGVIKVLGSNIPTLPLVRWLSGAPMLVTYQWDYAAQTRKNERGIKHWLAPLLEWLALAPADLVLVTVPWLEAKVQRVYHKKTILLPNWVDLSATRNALELARCNGMILYAGRLHPSKGVDVLIRAFARIKPGFPNARLLICGDGEERARLESLIASLKINDVEFRGVLPNAEVLRLMAQTAIFVLPTVTMEGHPKSLIEAMASGAACVVSDVPGNREMVEPERTALIVPPKDVNVLACALEWLLADRELRSKLGENARAQAMQIDRDQMIEKEIQTLRSLQFKL